MTFEEYKARKRWDTDIMTEEEKEAHLKHIMSMYGAITDETFVCPEDAIPVLAGV